MKKTTWSAVLTVSVWRGKNHVCRGLQPRPSLRRTDRRGRILSGRRLGLKPTTTSRQPAAAAVSGDDGNDEGATSIRYRHRSDCSFRMVAPPYPSPDRSPMSADRSPLPPPPPLRGPATARCVPTSASSSAGCGRHVTDKRPPCCRRRSSGLRSRVGLPSSTVPGSYLWTTRSNKTLSSCTMTQMPGWTNT